MSRRRPELQRYRWRSLRQATINRDGRQCQRCGSLDDLQVHHLDAVSDGNPEIPTIDRLITLCQSCHQAVHGKKPPTATAWDRFADDRRL